MLHGLTSHARSWDHIAPAFADQFYIVALDQRGHGDSEHPSPPAYATDEYVADLAAVADALNLERFVLMGLSMGAHNSLAFAAAQPARVSRLIPVDIGPAFNRREEGHAVPAAPPPRLFESREAAWEHARTTNLRAGPTLLRERWMNNLRDLPDGRVELKYDAAAPREWRPADLWERLPSLTMPVLVIRGAESNVLSADVARRMTAAMPDARLVEIEGAGHPVPLDRPHEFIAAVQTFLGDR
jgi:pimeloyl-ACP methyl ester carboxylesterase